jgi:hypothetical protein
MLILLAKWSLPLNGNVVVSRMYVKCKKGEKGLCVVVHSCAVLFCFFGRFSKIYSMSKDVELESCFGHILYC